MGYPIDAIEGVGPVLKEKFTAAGIRSVEKLLKEGGAKKGRKAIASATGIDEKKVLRFVNHADLMRIKGVSSQYSELLEAAGVDTVKELRNRNAENLQKKMAEVNADKKLVRQVPSLSQTEGFVSQAKGLEPMVSH